MVTAPSSSAPLMTPIGTRGGCPRKASPDGGKSTRMSSCVHRSPKATRCKRSSPPRATRWDWSSAPARSGGFAGMLLGSVGQGVLHHATCPVVIVPGP
ncbi:universal stress protein [Yinghuangia aomiensis]